MPRSLEDTTGNYWKLQRWELCDQIYVLGEPCGSHMEDRLKEGILVAGRVGWFSSLVPE